MPVELGPNDPEPSWYQVAELPRLDAVVTEYRAHARTCPGCGTLNQATITAEVRAHVIGPRLAAMMSDLSGRFHIITRSVRELVEAASEVPVSLGTVAALEQQTSVALIPAHDQARDAVRDAPAKNTDESGWKQAGARRWLWTAATLSAAHFVIHFQRGARGLQALLGEAITGIIITDRWPCYTGVPLADAVSGLVAVRGRRGSRTDEQPRGADLEDGRARAEERHRVPQRVGLPIRGAHY